MPAFNLTPIILLLGLFVLGCQDSGNSPRTGLKGLDAFKFNESAAPAISDRESILIGKGGDNRIKLHFFQVKGSDEAKKKMTDEVSLQIRQYKHEIPPYPGQFTAAVGCDPELRPKLEGSDSGSNLYYFSNDRLGPIICLKDNITYRTILGFYYLPKTKRLVKVEYFIPKGRAQDEFKRFATLNIDSKIVFDSKFIELIKGN